MRNEYHTGVDLNDNVTDSGNSSNQKSNPGTQVQIQITAWLKVEVLQINQSDPGHMGANLMTTGPSPKFDAPTDKSPFYLTLEDSIDWQEKNKPKTCMAMI